jgi:ribosomal protein S18 acetylase RimI-like enzyme
MTEAAPAAGSLELARRIQASIRADAGRWRDVERIGPLVATFSRDDANPYLNYAIPDEAAAPSQAEVTALVDAYRVRGRKPRLEYLPALAPAVEPALVAGGLAVERRLPLMTCSSAAHLHELEVSGIELVAAGSEDELRAAEVQWEAYEEAGDVPQRVIDGLRRSAASGGLVVLARDIHTGESAGPGQRTAPEDGLTELTSVGVRAAFRRRGIAQALAGRLARDAFGNGAGGVFLMAHGEAEARIYERAGFERISEVLLVGRR